MEEGASRDKVAAELLNWDAQDFERAAREAGMCATMCRNEKEWNSTEIARSTQLWLEENHGCPVKVAKVTEQGTPSCRRQSPSDRRPMRVIEMARVIAAPVAGRTLASEFQGK